MPGTWRRSARGHSFGKRSTPPMHVTRLTVAGKSCSRPTTAVAATAAAAVAASASSTASAAGASCPTCSC